MKTIIWHQLKDRHHDFLKQRIKEIPAIVPFSPSKNPQKSQRKTREWLRLDFFEKYCFGREAIFSVTLLISRSQPFLEIFILRKKKLRHNNVMLLSKVKSAAEQQIAA